MIPDVLRTGGNNFVVNAHLAGVGQERATLAIHVNNMSPSDIDIEQLCELPWFAKPLIHTLKVQVNGSPLESTILL
jgi:Gpi16 subunit, GPI transamidase component